MPQHRSLLPRIVGTPPDTASGPSRRNLVANARVRKEKATRKRHSPEEWNAHKSLILQLYNSHELKDVIRIVTERTGFNAGIRRYKAMLATWGQEKYAKGPEMQFVLQTYQSRLRNEKKATAFIIRDTQLENDQIIHYQTRSYTSQEGDGEALFETSATPEGIQYFTPRSPLALWQLMQQSPHAFTPTSKRTAFATALSQASMSDKFTATILAYDHLVEIKQVEVRLRSPKKRLPALSDKSVGRSRQCNRQQDRKLGTSPLDQNGNITRKRGSGDYYSKRHSHQVSTFAGHGNGRFTSGNQISEMLWQALRSALALGTLNSKPSEDVPSSEMLLQSSSREENVPYYWLETNTEMAFSAEAFIAQIKNSPLARKVLGLTKTLYKSWLGEWRQVEGNDIPILKSVANHCFGDPFLSFPSLGLVSIIIRIENHSPTEQSFLLRVTYGRESRSEYLSCAQCDNAILVLDFSGPSGALKIQAPINAFSVTYATKTFKDFLAKTDLRTTVLNDRQSSLAYHFQGFQTAKHFRRCHCNGRIHELGFREHYIDMEAEVTAREEKFDPNCLNEVAEEDTYQPYPPDIDSHFFTILVEDPDDHEDRAGLDEHGEGGHERWDPDGDADASESEAWDPCPSEDEVDSHYVTQAVFCRTE